MAALCKTFPAGGPVVAAAERLILLSMPERLWSPASADGRVGHFVEEGLIIVGWVALWRPLEIFLYDWWPIAQKKKFYRRLAAAHVSGRFYDEADKDGVELAAAKSK